MDEAGEAGDRPRHRAPGPPRIPQQRRPGSGAPADGADDAELACLRLLRDGRSRTRRECERAVGGRREQTGSALWHLVRTGAVRRSSMHDYAITDTGRYRLLRSHAEVALELEPLVPAPVVVVPADRPTDPLAEVEASLERVERAVAADLLARLRTREPEYVERAVLALLAAMGYGGPDPVRLRAQLFGAQWGRGVIGEDPLGLRRLLVQVVRRGATDVLRPAEVEVFALDLRAPRVDQGVYLTTGPVSAEAHEHAGTLPSPVTLVDGERLAALLVGYGVGVRARRTVSIPEVDEHFFG